MKRQKLKRILATVLAVALIGTSVPLDAWASESTKAVDEEEQLVTETETTQSEEEQVVKETDTEQNETDTENESESGNIIDSGTCGESVTWTLTEDGTLTVSGTGTIPNTVKEDILEWDAYREQIKKIVVEDGITDIGAYAFDGMIAVEEIEVAGSVNYVRDYAFEVSGSFIKGKESIQ